MTRQAETEHVRCFYDTIANRYDAYVGHPERLLLGDGRPWVCSQASGAVLEIGVGTGQNLPYSDAHRDCHPEERRISSGTRVRSRR